MFAESLCRFIGRASGVNPLQVSSDFRPHFPGNVVQAVAHYIDDAQLNGGMRINHLYKTGRFSRNSTLQNSGGFPCLAIDLLRPQKPLGVLAVNLGLDEYFVQIRINVAVVFEVFQDTEGL